MKIKIDTGGFLHLERAGKMESQYCPHQQVDQPCGDWCPLFGEVEMVGGNTRLRVCETSWIGEIEDGRVGRCEGGTK